MRSTVADEFIAKMATKKTPYFKTINKIKLRIDKNVCATGKLGELFYKALSLPIIDINTKKTVLDYGTGTGFLAIAAAQKGASVVGIDKNPAAIKCAKFNAEKNNVSDHIDFRISDNLSAIGKGEKFDIVLAGLPWENAIPNTLLEMSFYDPEFSMRMALSKQADTLLKPEGSILVSYSKRMQANEPIEKFFPNCHCEVLLEEIIHDEPHYILCLRPY